MDSYSPLLRTPRGARKAFHLNCGHSVIHVCDSDHSQTSLFVNKYLILPSQQHLLVLTVQHSKAPIDLHSISFPITVGCQLHFWDPLPFCKHGVGFLCFVAVCFGVFSDGTFNISSMCTQQDSTFLSPSYDLCAITSSTTQ